MSYYFSSLAAKAGGWRKLTWLYFQCVPKRILTQQLSLLTRMRHPPLNLLRFLGKQSQSIGPYSLVQLAYKGDLVKQGIPGQATLLAAHRDGQLSASRLVLGARLAKIVSPQMAACPIYQDAVETALLMHYLWRPNQQLTGDLNSRFE